MSAPARTLRSLLMLGLTIATCAASGAGDRLVSTDAGTTAMILALSRGSSLVGVDSTSQHITPHLPDVGYYRQLSGEGLLSLRPTHVIGHDQMGPASALELAEAAGVAITRLPSPTSLPELAANLRAVALTLNVESADIESLLAGYVASPPRGLTALMLLGRGGTVKAAGSGTGGHALLAWLGLTNLAPWDGYRIMADEALLATDPDVILIATETPGLPELDTWLEQRRFARVRPDGRSRRCLAVDSRALVSGFSLLMLEEARRLEPALAGITP